MVESTEKNSHTLKMTDGESAAAQFVSLLDFVNKRSDAQADLAYWQELNPELDHAAILQIVWLKQAFASVGVKLDDENALGFYQSTRALEPEQALGVIKNISSRISEFRSFGDPAFDYEDWSSVQEIERNFLEFGLTFSSSELYALYQAETAEVFTVFRQRVHSGVSKMLQVIRQDDDTIPDWLESILSGMPGAEKIVLAETEEREVYKNLLNTHFDSLGLTNRRYLVEQVLDSWSHG